LRARNKFRREKIHPFPSRSLACVDLIIIRSLVIIIVRDKKAESVPEIEFLFITKACDFSGDAVSGKCHSIRYRETQEVLRKIQIGNDIQRGFSDSRVPWREVLMFLVWGWTVRAEKVQWKT
jgi:hypothetical protein